MIRRLSQISLVCVFLASTSLVVNANELGSFHKQPTPALKNPQETSSFYRDLRRIQEPQIPQSSGHYTEQERTANVPTPQYAPMPQPVYQPVQETPLPKVSDKKPLQARAELNHRYSNDCAITMTEFWVPLGAGC